jgi:hypothetical protein
MRRPPEHVLQDLDQARDVLAGLRRRVEAGPADAQVDRLLHKQHAAVVALEAEYRAAVAASNET